MRTSMFDDGLPDAAATFALDATDLRLIEATQAGLPICARPYHALGGRLGLDADEVMARLTRMRDGGVVRRIAAVPNHYRLGYRANAMTVWDVEDAAASALGREVAALEFVSHCYRRPRRPPHWPYNLFVMVHGHERAETETKIAAVARVLDGRVRGRAVLYSTRILKKTGLRIRSADE